MKSCKNQPNASISIMSGRSDLCLPAGIVLAACLHTMQPSCVSSSVFFFPPALGGMCTSQTGMAEKYISLVCVCVSMPQRSEMKSGRK